MCIAGTGWLEQVYRDCQQGSGTVLQPAELLGYSNYVIVFESIFIKHTSQSSVFYLPVPGIAEGNFLFPKRIPNYIFSYQGAVFLVVI